MHTENKQDHSICCHDHMTFCSKHTKNGRRHSYNWNNKTTFNDQIKNYLEALESSCCTFLSYHVLHYFFMFFFVFLPISLGIKGLILQLASFVSYDYHVVLTQILLLVNGLCLAKHNQRTYMSSHKFGDTRDHKKGTTCFE